MKRSAKFFGVLPWLVALAAFSVVGGLACRGGGAGNSDFDNGVDGAAAAPTGGGGATDAGLASSSDDGPSLGLGNAPDAGAPAAQDAAPVPVVYAHSAGFLYKLDTTTNTVSVVAPFIGCTNVIDIALDEASKAYVTTETGFYSLNLSNGVCTHIADGSYPNSLSFVPKGTLSATAETLVGYVGAQYIQIDTTTGAITNVGSLSGGYQSSGDIVSVIGGGTFLTVNGNGCGDCLLQVDPVTGDVVQNYGSVGHADVYGLAFWAGTAYGFDNAGELFSIDVAGGSVVTTNIPLPATLLGLSFWGAGSTTAAPPTAADGGGIPIEPPK
jgi:hypothetical protein